MLPCRPKHKEWDKYEVKMPKADLKHSNFTDQKLEGLSRFLNRFFNPALLLSDGHKRLINSIQPDFTLFFESFLNLKSNYQDFIAQSETLFKFILDDLPDAKVDFDEKNAKVIAESLDTPKTSFITPTLIPLYPFSNDQIVELLQQKKAFIYCLRRVEYDGAFHWAIHKSVPLEFICSIIKEKTNASAVSIPEDLRVLFHDYLSQMPFFSLNITFYYLMNDSKEGDNRLCVLENKNSFESLIFLAQRNLIDPNDVLTKMTGLSDYLFKFLPTNEQLKHFRTELKDAELDDFISTLAKDLLKELQYLKAIFEQCKLNQIKRSQIIVIKNELSAVRLHLLASTLVGASKESLKTLNDYKNIFNQILCDCLKLTDEYLIDEDLFYSNIQSTICSMWSDFYDFCYAEMDELGKTLAFKSKPEPQVAALQVFLFPKLDMLYANIFNQLMWEVGEDLHFKNLNSSIALGLTISFFQFFGFFKNVEYSTTFLLNITLPWFKKKKSELGLNKLFFDSMLQEYKLAFSTLKSVHTQPEIVLLRIIHECAAEYYESLVHLNGRQLPSIPNQFFELRSDFFGLSVFPEDYLNLGFKNAARFNFTDYQSPLQDEWFNVKSFESIINKSDSNWVFCKI